MKTNPSFIKSSASLSILQIQTARVFESLLEPYWGPGTPGRYKGAYGGRGSAKSHFFAEMAVERCIEYPRTRIVCVREVQKSLKESVKLLIEDKIDGLGVGSQFKVLSDKVITPGGGVVLFQGMQDHTAESVKSLEDFDIAYAEEAQTLTQRSLEFLRPTIRKDATADRPGSELWFAWNPRNASDAVDQLLRGDTPHPSAVVVETSYLQNPFFPAVLEEEREYDEVHSPARYAHIWLGDYEPAAVGAIWSMDIINRHRKAKEKLPDMRRVVVSIDPAGSSQEGANQTGIVVCAIGEDDRGYVLEDYSLVGTPQEWAERALAAYDLHEADAIIAETNYGGDMVKATIRAVRPMVRVIEVRASRGKHIRAEPISALYALGKESHAGAFPKLEAQMCLITAEGYEGEGSPDRVDAMVWGFSELFPKLTRKGKSRRPNPTRANSNYNPHGRWHG